MTDLEIEVADLKIQLRIQEEFKQQYYEESQMLKHEVEYLQEEIKRLEYNASINTLYNK